MENIMNVAQERKRIVILDELYKLLSPRIEKKLKNTCII